VREVLRMAKSVGSEFGDGGAEGAEGAPCAFAAGGDGGEEEPYPAGATDGLRGLPPSTAMCSWAAAALRAAHMSAAFVSALVAVGSGASRARSAGPAPVPGAGSDTAAGKDAPASS
jgi:hypothetical protein